MRILATAEIDGTVRYWNTTSGVEIAVLKMRRGV
jgi:hypothetical protein